MASETSGRRGRIFTGCLLVMGVLLFAGCSFESGLGDLKCDKTGEQRAGAVCNDGYWYFVDAAATDATGEDASDVYPPSDITDLADVDATEDIDDIGDCHTGNLTCASNAACVEQSAGSWACECNSGYMGDGSQCANIDECATGDHNCHIDAICTDTPGSFTCACNTPAFVGDGITCHPAVDCQNGPAICDTNAECTEIAEEHFICECQPGYSGSGTQCDDINECAPNSEICGPGGTCINSPGSYRCECDSGFVLNNASNICEDVNECADGSHNCDPRVTCTNTAGSYSCAACPAGYTDTHGDGSQCEDIDECATNSAICGTGGTCNNTVGGFECACAPGYELNASGVCADIDECAATSEICGPGGTCTNTDGGFECTCASGTIEIDDGVGCRLPQSCLDARDNAITASGIYTIQPPSADSTPAVASFDVYCDMDNHGGGWTLAIKADGNQSTFLYGEEIWTNKLLLNADHPDLDRTEAKLKTFNTVAFTKVMIGLEHPIDATDPLSASDLNYLVLDASANSLHDIFTRGFTATDRGRKKWKDLIDGSSLQTRCGREGFNSKARSGFSQVGVRIGILGNNENNCDTPDSLIGIGGGGDDLCGQPPVSVGNVAGDDIAFVNCAPDNGSVHLKAFGVVYVR